MDKFKIGDLVVIPVSVGMSCYMGDTGVISGYDPDDNTYQINFNCQDNEWVSGEGYWWLEVEQLKHYTPIEDLPLWKSNHMYLNDEQQQALRNLLHRVQWDEEYTEKIDMNLEEQSILFAFDWDETEEGFDFWSNADDQCDNEEIQKPDEIRSRAMGGVVDELCPTVTPCTITIDGLNNTSEYFLQRAIDLQKERGKEYDNGQERSMGKIVECFNIITGKQLSESEGWLFMQVLKDVRQWTKPEYHQDSAEDCVSYAALKAEALASGK